MSDGKKYDVICPSCGAKSVKVVSMRAGTERVYWVECEKCGAHGPVEYTETEAVYRWRIQYPSKQVMLQLEYTTEGTWMAYQTFPQGENPNAGIGNTPWEAILNLAKECMAEEKEDESVQAES